MVSGFSDTDPEAERVQLALLRRASPAQRIELALSLSESAIRLARDGIARRHPDASPEERGLRFVALHYGSDLAEEVRAYLAGRR